MSTPRHRRTRVDHSLHERRCGRRRIGRRRDDLELVEQATGRNGSTQTSERRPAASACQALSQPMPAPTATWSSTRSTWTAAWVIQRGRAPTAARVGGDLVVGRRRIGPVDDEHRFTVEVTGVHDVAGGEAVARRHGDMVDGDADVGQGGDALGALDRSTDDAGTERAGAHAVEDAQRRQAVGTNDGAGAGGPHRRRSPPSPPVRCHGSSRRRSQGVAPPARPPSRQSGPSPAAPRGRRAAAVRRPRSVPRCGSCARTGLRRGSVRARGFAARGAVS